MENLFNTTHDEGKDDWAYLPKASKGKGEQAAYCRSQNSKWRKRECQDLDWSQSNLEKKMRNLSEVILYKSPDILILQEVENIDVLEQMKKKYLESAGYKYATLLEGKDKRGIDVAIVSKFKPTAKPIYHQVPYPNPIGNILEVYCRWTFIKEYGWSVFVHFPSAANPHIKRVWPWSISVP